jgi:hypothetical protein
LDVLAILVRELWVFVLHNESDVVAPDSAQSTPNIKSKESPNEGKSSPNNFDPKVSSDVKPSLLGTVPLPSKIDLEDFDAEGSASDVPSHSSASSEDEEARTHHNRIWKICDTNTPL